PFRMLVVLSSAGAAVEQVELNDGTHDLDADDHSGYFGPIAETDALQGPGALVNVAGPGTPAAKVGLQPADVITSFNGRAITSAADFREALGATKPGDTVAVEYSRDGKRQPAANVTLERRPLKVISRELDRMNGGFNQASFLTTLSRIDDQKLALDDE